MISILVESLPLPSKPSNLRKKILIRIGSLRHGGAEKVLTIFLKNLPRDKYDVDLLLNTRSGKYLSEIPDWINIKYIINKPPILTNRPHEIPIKAGLVTYFSLFKKFPGLIYSLILKGKKYDVEFAANHHLLEQLLKSPNKASKKIIWIHNDLASLSDFPAERMKKYFAYDKIMVISDKIEQSFLKLATTEEERKRIIRIYNPIDTDEILAKSKILIDDFPFKNKYKTFIGIGTVHGQKGFDRLLEIHKNLLHEGHMHNILILGDGQDQSTLMKKAESYGVAETFVFQGFTDNPYPYLLASDFFILSSRYEGFPTVLYEAIALKKPILATDVSGVREMLENGRLGLVVENSAEGIYEGMKKFLQDSPLAESYHKNLLKYNPPFNLKNSVEEIQEIIDSL